MKDCCGKPENLYRKENDPEENPPHLIINRCKVCGSRHFELNAEPGAIGIEGASL